MLGEVPQSMPPDEPVRPRNKKSGIAGTIEVGESAPQPEVESGEVIIAPESHAVPEDPAWAIEADMALPLPPDVARALEEGADLEQEEQTGVFVPTREQEIMARLTILGIENPEEYAARHAKSIDLRLKVLEMNALRDQLAKIEAESLKKGLLAGSELKEKREAVREKYERARAEYVGESTLRLTRERALVTDAIAEKKIEEKGWGGKIYDGWKKLGELNLERAGWKPKGRLGKFTARFVSVRSAISFGLLGAGMALGAGAAAGAGLLALRRGLGGLGAGIGSYDLMRVGSEKWAETKGKRREVTVEEAKDMNITDVITRLENFEAWARLNGKKVSEISAYQTLLRTYRERLGNIAENSERETGVRVSEHLRRWSAEDDRAIDKRIEEMQWGERARKVVATGIGVFVGSGELARITGKAWHALFGTAEAPPDVNKVRLEGTAQNGEAVLVEPSGEVKYVPPVDTTAVESPAPQELVPSPEEVPPPEAPIETPSADVVIEAAKGDNSWKMAVRALHERFGDRFDNLDSARKSWITDWINKQIEKNPQDFGIRGTRLIRVGDKLDLTKLFEDPRMERAFGAAEKLAQEKVDSIAAHQSAVREFIKEHPGVKLRSGDVGRIIRGELSDANYEADVRPVQRPLGELGDFLARLPASPPAAEALERYASQVPQAPTPELPVSEPAPLRMSTGTDLAARAEARAVMDAFMGRTPEAPADVVPVRLPPEALVIPPDRLVTPEIIFQTEAFKIDLSPDAQTVMAAQGVSIDGNTINLPDATIHLNTEINGVITEKVDIDTMMLRGKKVIRILIDNNNSTRDSIIIQDGRVEQAMFGIKFHEPSVPAPESPPPEAVPSPSSAVIQEGIEARHDAGMAELQTTTEAADTFGNTNLPFEDRINALKSILTTDSRPIDYNGVKFALTGNTVSFKIGGMAARELTPQNADAVAQFIKFMKDEVPRIVLDDDRLQARTTEVMKAIYGSIPSK